MGVDPIREFYLWMNMLGIVLPRVTTEAKARGIAGSRSEEYAGLFLACKSSDPNAEIAEIMARYDDLDILAGMDRIRQHAERFADG